VAKREDTLLAQIERDALDESVSVATALRKCIALGGKSGSEKLRDWATRELRGYDGVAQGDLPPYRIVAAPLKMDAITPRAQITGQQFSPSVLPDAVPRGYIKEEVPFRQGVGEIEAMAKRSSINLMPERASDIVLLMNEEAGDPFQQILSIYWSVAPAALEGLVDQVRTALVQLVAELRASMSDADELPSAEAANQAVTLVMTGKRAQANVTTAQASSGSNATVNAPQQPEESGWWTRGRKIVAAVGVVATVAGTVFAGIQAF